MFVERHLIETCNSPERRSGRGQRYVADIINRNRSLTVLGRQKLEEFAEME